MLRTDPWRWIDAHAGSDNRAGAADTHCSAAVISLFLPLILCCYSAVLLLFLSPRRVQKMEMSQEVNPVTPQPICAPEQQTPAAPGTTVEAPKPRGRPWVKGQSGNPRGRPSRAYQAAYVAEALIGRKTVPLTNKLIQPALTGDSPALRACLDRIAPPRREPPIDLDLPEAINTRAGLLVALTEIANATASGALTSTQSATLTQMLIAFYQAT
jgi:hypothetical protein